MAHLIEHQFTDPSACPYLPNRLWILESRLMLDVTPNELQAMLERGWRRFGPDYFRPACGGCDACVSLRVPVETFQPSKSQRRALKKNAGVKVRIQRPIVDQTRVDLYHRWHRFRETARDWHENTLSLESYAMQFCFPHPCAYEMAYYEGDQLIGIGIVDATASALSSVYFFYDPDWHSRSPGIVSLLFEIDFAHKNSLTYLYLGYRVTGCASLEYKDRFRPNERLIGRPNADEPALWVLTES